MSRDGIVVVAEWRHGLDGGAGARLYRDDGGVHSRVLGAVGMEVEWVRMHCDAIRNFGVLVCHSGGFADGRGIDCHDKMEPCRLV